MATVTNLATTGDSTPGASSQDTASLAPTDGNSYLVVLATTRGLSANPDVATMTGWSQTWTELTSASLLFITTGTTRRRVQWFKTQVSGAPGAGVLTFSYTNTPDTCDWAVINLGPTGPDVVVAGSEKRSAAGATATGGTLWEPVTMNAVANAANRWVVYACVNVNDTTWRLELDADVNGDADWVTVASFGSNTTRTRDETWGWIDSTADNTPGVMGSLTGTAYLGAVEIDYNLSVAAVMAAALNGLTATATASVEHVVTAAAALNGLTAVATAGVSHDAVAAAALNGLTATAVATVEHAATAAAALNGLTATASASVDHPAVLAAALGGITANATATTAHVAVADAQLNGLTATATATVEHAATATADLGALTAHADADVESGSGDVNAVMAAPLGGIVATATATVTHDATGSAPLGGLTATLTATVELAASGVAGLGALTATATATVDHPATMVALLGAITATATASVEHHASAIAALGPLVATATATAGSVDLGGHATGSVYALHTAAGGLTTIHTIAGGIALLHAVTGHLAAVDDTDGDITQPSTATGAVGPT